MKYEHTYQEIMDLAKARGAECFERPQLIRETVNEWNRRSPKEVMELLGYNRHAITLAEK